MIRSIGFIGYGNMGSALATALHKESPETAFIVQEPDTAKVSCAVNDCGARVNLPVPEFCEASDIILVALKPQLLRKVLGVYAPYTKGKKIISIAAGTPISLFTELLSTDQVIRFMPNIAARVGKALTALSCAEKVTAEFRGEALYLAGCAGNTVELPESSMAAFTGLCGSGIAYVFAFLHALALGGTGEGIPYSTSLEIALGTLEGAVGLVREGDEHPVSLLSKVISPGGTTIQGVAALEEGGFTASVMDAVGRAASRARELE
ncbi:pyrroline-5-carboxylate reductase [Marispirochaeta aestuarii]|uniref:pyrroline-5-carboxylate reductase n=1 Tax=Marispirochaeta aestuarii TaxID=1963862 RepID=UPI0029C8A739|nr:pyrroline-5-carboxylate reductase [Marispirochaeta aestuarii]